MKVQVNFLFTMEEASSVSMCTFITVHIFILHLYENHDLTFFKLTL